MSKSTLERQEILEARQTNGQISDLQYQPQYPCYVTDTYGKKVKIVTVVPDFSYEDVQRGTIAEFVGANKSALNRIKFDLLQTKHGVMVEVVK